MHDPVRDAPAAAAALALLLLLGGCGSPPDRIVFIVVDTLRADAPSFAGGAASTPHLDALAARGEVVPDVVASFHNTSMTMGAIFSGRSPSLESGDARLPLSWTPRNWCGLARFADAGQSPRRCVPEGLETLGQRMAEAGYETLGIVSNPLLFEPAGFSPGFDHWEEVGEGGALRMLRLNLEGGDLSALADLRAGRAVTAAALDVVDARASDRFFLYVHYMDVHDWNLYPDESYEGAVARADAAVGDLLDGLEQRGLLADAAVVFTADHGEALGEDHFMPGTPRHLGAPSFEPVLRVPLVLVNAGFEVGDALVRSQDVYGLLARIAGGDPSSGSSPLRPQEVLVSERLYQVYRDGRYKSFQDRRDGSFHLVDLAADPGERHDVASRQPDVAAAHRARVAELTDALAAPEGKTVTLGAQDAHRLRVLGYLE
jgi:arylsulfatase A-like enzyme